MDDWRRAERGCWKLRRSCEFSATNLVHMPHGLQKPMGRELRVSNLHRNAKCCCTVASFIRAALYGSSDTGGILAERRNRKSNQAFFIKVDFIGCIIFKPLRYHQVMCFRLRGRLVSTSAPGRSASLRVILFLCTVQR